MIILGGRALERWLSPEGGALVIEVRRDTEETISLGLYHMRAREEDITGSPEESAHQKLSSAKSV